jgi:hypothetical protein
LNATTGNIDGRIHASQLHVRLTIASCYAHKWPLSFLKLFNQFVSMITSQQERNYPFSREICKDLMF